MTVPETWLDDALAARYDHHTGFPVAGSLEHQGFAPTCCLFVRREVFADSTTVQNI